MVRPNKISTRYARAIFALLSETKSTEKGIEELVEFDALLTEHANLRQVLSMDRIPVTQRKEILSDLLKKVKASTGTQRSLEVILDMGRMGSISHIIYRLKSLLLESKKVASLYVESPIALNHEDRTNLESKFKKILKKEVTANYQVAPELLGGVRVTAEGCTYDGTLSGWLDAFEEQLVGGAH